MLGLTLGVQAETWIQAGQLYDGHSETMAGPSTVVIEGDRVVRVFSGFKKPGKGVELIDLRTSTLLPGF